MHIPHLSPSPRVPTDRFGQAIAPGDLVTYSPGDPTVHVVTDVRPLLAPNAPPGAIQVTLTCTVNVLVQSGARTPGLTRIGYLGQDGKTPMIGSAVRTPGVSDDVPDPPPDGQAGPQLVQ